MKYEIQIIENILEMNELRNMFMTMAQCSSQYSSSESDCPEIIEAGRDVSTQDQLPRDSTGRFVDLDIMQKRRAFQRKV